MNDEIKELKDEQLEKVTGGAFIAGDKDILPPPACPKCGQAVNSEILPPRYTTEGLHRPILFSCTNCDWCEFYD